MAEPTANPPYDDSLLEQIHADQNTNTGIENKKLIMWLFLASDCMFFGTLISTHLIYRKLYPFGHPQEGQVNITGTFDIELTSFSTFILLMSSFLMALAVSAMHKGSIESFRRYTFGVIIFGLIFLAGQVYEFQHFFHGQGWYEWEAKSDAGQVIVGNEQNKLLFHDVAKPAAAKEGFQHKQFGLELLKFEPAKDAAVNGAQPVRFLYEVDLPDTVGNAPETFYGEYIYHPGDPHASQIVVLSDIPPPPAAEEDEKKEEASSEDKPTAEDGEETAQNSGDQEGEKTAQTENQESSEAKNVNNEEAAAEQSGQSSAESGEQVAASESDAKSEPKEDSTEKEAHASTAESHSDEAAHGEDAAHGEKPMPIPTSMADMKSAAKDAFKHSNYGFHLENFKSVKTIPGLDMRTSVFGSTFYVMTGTHGTHVALGVLWLFSLLIYSYSGRLTPLNAMDVEIAGLYWHFVDIVWIVIFTAVYLVEYI